MKDLDFCLVTPSYAPDFERCKLLCASVAEFVEPKITHYIIVDKQDLSLFSQLKNSHTEVIVKEDILPWWIKKIPVGKNNWLSLKTLPLRGWIIQQLIKLGIAETVNHDVLVFADSDVAFLRPFNFQSLIKEDKIRFFCEPKAIDTDLTSHCQWYQVASKVLQTKPIAFPASNYISQLITWKRNNVLKLHQHIENVSGKGWIETLGNCLTLSEYVLYGVFVEEILQTNSEHYYESQDICYTYWPDRPMSELELEQFFSQIQPHHVAVMISAKAGMSVDKYQQLLKKIPQI